MDKNVIFNHDKNTIEFDHTSILSKQQLFTRIAIPILSIYVLTGVLKYDPFSESYYDGCYNEIVFRFRICTLFLIILGYSLPYLTTRVFTNRTKLSYLLLITLVIIVFHWLDGAWLNFDYFYVTFALTLIIFHPYLYGPASLGHAHDSLYIQCVIAILITSTGVLFSSLSLLTDRLDFYWKAPIPLYIINYLSMMTTSIANMLPISHPALRCN